MADIYCDNTNGNDSTGDGSSGTPYKTLQKCVDNAAGGDVIWIGDTSAQVLSTATSWASGWAAGTGETAYLTIRGWDYSGGAGVAGIGEIDGNAAAANVFSTTSTPNYVVLLNLYMHDTTGYVLDGNGQRWHIIDCEVALGGGGGIDSMSNLKVINCHVHDNTGHGVRLSSSGLLQGCFVTDNSGDNVACGGTFVVVTGNLIKNPGTANIFSTQDDTTIINNTIVGDGTSNNIGISIQTSGTGNGIFTNNIITDHAGGTGIGIKFTGAKTVVVGNNQFNNNNTNMDSAVSYVTLTDSTTNPDYVATGSDDYTPQAFVDAYPTTYPGSGTTTENKIGAVQEAGGAAGGGLMEPGSMNGGMV